MAKARKKPSKKKATKRRSKAKRKAIKRRVKNPGLMTKAEAMEAAEIPRLSTMLHNRDKLLAAYAEGVRDFTYQDLTGLALMDDDLSGADFEGSALIDTDLGAANLRGVKMHQAKLDYASFWGANLNASDLSGASVHNTKFNSADLRRALLENMTGSGAEFHSAKMRGADLENALLTDSRFTAADLTDARLRGAHLSGSFFDRAVLNGADFQEVVAEGATFTGSPPLDMRGAKFDASELEGADFSGIHAQKVSFFQAKGVGIKLIGGTFIKCSFLEAKFIGGEFEGATFFECDFTKARLFTTYAVGCDFKGSSFRDAFLNDGNFSDSNFEGADLRWTKCERANFSGCNLDGADLQGADLEAVNLNNAHLIGTNFKDAIMGGMDFRYVDLSMTKNVPVEYLRRWTDEFEGTPLEGTIDEEGFILTPEQRDAAIQETLESTVATPASAFMPAELMGPAAETDEGLGTFFSPRTKRKLGVYNPKKKAKRVTKKVVRDALAKSSVPWEWVQQKPGRIVASKGKRTVELRKWFKGPLNKGWVVSVFEDGQVGDEYWRSDSVLEAIETGEKLFKMPAKKRRKKAAKRHKNPTSPDGIEFDASAVTKGKLPFYRGARGGSEHGATYFISSEMMAKFYGPVSEYRIKLRNPKFVSKEEWSGFDSIMLRVDPSPIQELEDDGYDSAVWVTETPQGHMFTVFALDGEAVSKAKNPKKKKGRKKAPKGRKKNPTDGREEEVLKQYGRGQLSFRGLGLDDTDFRGVNMPGLKLISADLNDADLRDSNFKGGSFEKSRMLGTNFKKANLRKVSFAKVVGQNVVFINADLSMAWMNGSSFLESDFRGAGLTHANLEDAQLIGSDFSRADLRRANLRNADFTGSNLELVDLKGANLEGVNLDGVDLEYVRLGEAFNVPEQYLSDEVAPPQGYASGDDVRGARQDELLGIVFDKEIPESHIGGDVAHFTGAEVEVEDSPEWVKRGMTFEEWMRTSNPRKRKAKKGRKKSNKRRSKAKANPALISAKELGYFYEDGIRNFDDSALVGQNLSGMDLRGATFRNANLYGADFRGADIRGTNFTGADLGTAKMEGAIVSRETNLTDVSAEGVTGTPRYEEGFWDQSTAAEKSVPEAEWEYQGGIRFNRGNGPRVTVDGKVVEVAEPTIEGMDLDEFIRHFRSTFAKAGFDISDVEILRYDQMEAQGKSEGVPFVIRGWRWGSPADDWFATNYPFGDWYLDGLSEGVAGFVSAEDDAWPQYFRARKEAIGKQSKGRSPTSNPRKRKAKKATRKTPESTRILNRSLRLWDAYDDHQIKKNFLAFIAYVDGPMATSKSLKVKTARTKAKRAIGKEWKLKGWKKP